MGFLNWIRNFFTMNPEKSSSYYRRKEKQEDEDEEEIQELIAIDII